VRITNPTDRLLDVIGQQAQHRMVVDGLDSQPIEEQRHPHVPGQPRALPALLPQAL
jgi:hypothetical protein